MHYLTVSMTESVSTIENIPTAENILDVDKAFTGSAPELETTDKIYTQAEFITSLFP